MTTLGVPQARQLVQETAHERAHRLLKTNPDSPVSDDRKAAFFTLKRAVADAITLNGMTDEQVSGILRKAKLKIENYRPAGDEAEGTMAVIDEISCALAGEAYIKTRRLPELVARSKSLGRKCFFTRQEASVLERLGVSSEAIASGELAENDRRAIRRAVALISKLSEEEHRVVVLRYGLEGGEAQENSGARRRVQEGRALHPQHHRENAAGDSQIARTPALAHAKSLRPHFYSFSS